VAACLLQIEQCVVPALPEEHRDVDAVQVACDRAVGEKCLRGGVGRTGLALLGLCGAGFGLETRALGVGRAEGLSRGWLRFPEGLRVTRRAGAAARDRGGTEAEEEIVPLGLAPAGLAGCKGIPWQRGVAGAQ